MRRRGYLSLNSLRTSAALSAAPPEAGPKYLNKRARQPADSLCLGFRTRCIKGLRIGRDPRPGANGLVYGLQDFLIPGAKGKIGKAALVSADALDEVVHFEYLDVKIPEAAAGKIKTKESRILRNL